MNSVKYTYKDYIEAQTAKKQCQREKLIRRQKHKTHSLQRSSNEIGSSLLKQKQQGPENNGMLSSKC